MSMTKRDFIALAEYLTDESLMTWAYDEWGNIDPKKLREHLANFCHSRNPAFKHQRWLDYIAGWCGKNGGRRRGWEPKKKRRGTVTDKTLCVNCGKTYGQHYGDDCYSDGAGKGFKPSCFESL